MGNTALLGQSATDSGARICDHCGDSFRAVSKKDKFCCHGCESVYFLLQDHGLERFYEIREQNPPTCPLPARVSSETFAFCDDPEIIARFTRSENEMEFFVEGLNCSACLWLLEKLPELCDDVAVSRVNFAKSTVTVVRKPSGSFSKAAHVLNRIGYAPRLIHDSSVAEALRKRERKISLIRIGIAAACTGNIMIFAVSLYGGASGSLRSQFEWLTAALATPVLTYCAYPFYKSAWASLRSRNVNLDVPIVAALFAGIVMSFWSLLTGSGAVYFDSLSMLVFLLLSSRTWLKSLQQGYLDASHLEDSLLVGSVERLLENGLSERVSTLSLKPGDRVVVEGERLVPADGKVLKGSGTLQTAALTGESTPLEVREGETVFAGTRNISGHWILEVLKPAAESRLATILRDAERSAKSKPKMVRLADEVGRWFVLVVFLIAVVLCVSLISMGRPAEGFARALALVIVTCPCVFGMAIPLSLSLAVRAAAARGIIIKDGEVIERLQRIKTLFFDKTGTLTDGKLAVQDLQFIAPSSDIADELAAVVALEKDQEHPVGQALLVALKDFDLERWRAEGVQMRSRGGIEGWINGQHYSIRPLGVRGANHEMSDRAREEVQTCVGLYRQETLLIRFTLGEHVRTDAKRSLDQLRRDGFATRMLSGDRESVVQEVGHRLGFDAKDLLSECSPEKKSAVLTETETPAAMIGDGANDAAALGAASIGIAVRGSMEVSLKSADVYLLQPNLQSIRDLFSIGKTTHAAIVRNLVFSVCFNLGAGLLAITGNMQPLWAAVLMPLSSLTVLSSALITGKRQARRSK